MNYKQVIELGIVPMLVGLLVSLLFLLLISRVRPMFVISEHIARLRQEDPLHPPGPCDRGYAVKVLNVSSHSAVEVRARLAWAERLTVGGGEMTSTTDFTLQRDSLFELPGSSEDREASAFRFITPDPIEDQWVAGRHLVFTLFAKHELSGFGKVFTKRYYLKDDVINDGTFRIGDSMEIV